MYKTDLLDAIHQVMPHGKYKGRQLLDIPEPCLVWHHNRGFPQDMRGLLLSTRRTRRTRCLSIIYKLCGAALVSGSSQGL